MDRYCTNCRAEIPPKADSCPACGVYAGDVFDGTWPRKKTHTRMWLTLLVLAAALAGAAVWYQRSAFQRDGGQELALPSTHVVGDRPGGARRARGARVTEAEAVRLLRRTIVEEKRVANDCIAAIGERARPAYTFNVVDTCAGVRLGRWRVDPRSGEVAPLRPN